MYLARHLAASVREVLNGADPGTLPTLFDPGRKLTINMATARAVHVYPDWDLLIKAELINEAATAMESNAPMRRLNIRTAVKEALSANLGLAAARRSVDAGAARVSQTRSPLLPQITINTRAGVIDDDRAQAYAGTLPEREWTGGIQASQLIYLDKAWAGFEIEKHLQVSREQGRDAVRLDILQSSASAYLNVLRAKTIEKIQAENLKLTRKNLERAREELSQLEYEYKSTANRIEKQVLNAVHLLRPIPASGSPEMPPMLPGATLSW
nr:TolC family protein [uncultured Desulfobacter sp.]